MQRLRDHERFEMAMLYWLGSKRFLGSLAFGGGTMLRLCHELPRYSLDMVFWFFKQEDYDDFYLRLHESISRDQDVTDAHNKYYSILIEIRLKKGMPRLKMELRKTVAPIGSTEEKIAFSPHFPRQVLVRGFTSMQMMKNKVLALIDRGEIRDAFDLEFLVRKGVPLELTEDQRQEVLKRLKDFKKKDFDVKLGSILEPDLRNYYRQRRFAYLEEKLSFDEF
ncbi:MAG: nucleotidyl transferase AbiEii/AbiGii toxin family protein [Deltaproteobacteria bacterium]|nr:nucleotidyl transferase AbiEii/AbiGii toxin family protein [Deltaproteobacteria bacterium]